MPMTAERFVRLMETLNARARTEGQHLLVVTPEAGGVYSQAFAAGDGVEIMYWNETKPRNVVRIEPAELDGLLLHDTGLHAGRFTAKIASVPALA